MCLYVNVHTRRLIETVFSQAHLLQLAHIHTHSYIVRYLCVYVYAPAGIYIYDSRVCVYGDMTIFIRATLCAARFDA